MSDAKLVNIARLMTTYNFQIEQLPDKLKCAQCKLVLKDACQLPCCCRYCRVCIVDMIEIKVEFCLGGSDECGESLLSCYQSDYVANKGVSRLTVKCPHDGCVYKCQLANIEEHLRECPRKGEDCPFRELGCTQDKFTVKEMGEHLQHDNRRHNEILIRMIVNINREIGTLKQRDKDSSREIETLKQRDKDSSREIETLKQRYDVSSREIEILKDRLLLHDEQIRSIIDQMIHVQNENRSIENTIKLIKEEKEYLVGPVRNLTEEVEREIAERCQNDELDSARMIDHVDREVASVTLLIGSNNDKFISEMQSVRGDIGSIVQDIRWIKNDICSVKSQVQSVQALVGLEQFDASFVQLIDIDVDKTRWEWGDKLSEYFTGAVHPYKYRLVTGNWNIGTASAQMWIALRIYAGQNDGQLAWPFEARVVITVTDRDRREACRSISLQCRIERPPDNDYRWSDYFVFPHSELRRVGLILSRGVRVSCGIVPGIV